MSKDLKEIPITTKFGYDYGGGLPHESSIRVIMRNSIEECIKSIEHSLQTDYHAHFTYFFDKNPPHIISDHYKSKNINIDDLLFIEGCVNKKIKKYMESLES
jgi:hypothetical protein